MKGRELETVRRLLCAFQSDIRDQILRARRRPNARFAQVAAVTAADTIYRVDRLSEHAILGWFGAHWPATLPVELVMEGREGLPAATFPAGTAVGATRWKCLIDPIDGTRNLMYDKRSAWILAGVAPQRGPGTHLGQIVVAAMTEVPVSKQWRSDQFSAVRGGGLRATAVDLRSGATGRLRVRPSGARDCRGGFASFTRFFPEGKAFIAMLEESLWRGLYGRAGRSSPMIFDDQYISTGGQLAELITGHDRFICDLRPLVFARLRLGSALVCHPYDIVTALLAREAGCVVEHPLGGRLQCPLDTVSPVSWVGYANRTLARHLRPALQRVLRRHLGTGARSG